MTRFDGKLIIGCTSELPKAIDEAATARLMKPSEYVRRAIIDRLQADGVAIGTPDRTTEAEASA